MPETAVSQTKCHSDSSTASNLYRLRSVVTHASTGPWNLERQRVSIGRQSSQIICLSTCAKSATVDVAPSRVDAERMLQDNDYDLIICDLRIPPSSVSAEADESHGLAVHALARDLSPGTPLMFLTAYPVSGATRRQLSLGEVNSLLGLGRQALVQLIEKDDIDGAEEIISMIFNAIEAIESGCTIEPDILHAPMFERAVKVYAASTGHNRAVVESTTGLSGAFVGRVKLQSDTVPPASIFLKVLASPRY